MIRLNAGAATDTGRVRTINQDQLLVTDNLFAVADGMGGHQGGEVASLTAVEALSESFGNARRADDLVEAAKEANRAVWRKAQADDALRGMGTTLTAVAVVQEEGEERLAILNIGDSRAYLMRHGDLDQLTEDHSLVEELVRTGQISETEAESHPRRNILTRAVGIEEEVEADVWQIAPAPGDRVLLCSDGLVREVADNQIASMLRRLADPKEAARELVAKAKNEGGSDNITVVVIDVADDGAPVEVDKLEKKKPRRADKQIAERDDDEQDAVLPSGRGDSPLTFRVVVFVTFLLAILGAAAFTVFWYARGSYYVGEHDGNVAIFQGRPGGFMWFDPTLEKVSTLSIDDVPPSRLDDVQQGKNVDSIPDGENYIEALRDDAARLRQGGGTSPTTTIASPPTAPAPTP